MTHGIMEVRKFMSSLFFSNEFKLSDIRNQNTINIFSDASIIKKKHGKFLGCYGTIAVYGDNIIEEKYRIASNTTVNNSEIKGIRSSLVLATKFSKYVSRINIFSDSLISILGLRDYIYNWRYNRETGMLITSDNKPVSNQSIFIECHQILKPIIDKVHLYHQPGHVGAEFEQLIVARNKFARENNINVPIDLNIIRYISCYNDRVDRKSRSQLRVCEKGVRYEDPVYFTTKGPISKIR